MNLHCDLCDAPLTGSDPPARLLCADCHGKCPHCSGTNHPGKLEVAGAELLLPCPYCRPGEAEVWITNRGRRLARADLVVLPFRHESEEGSRIALPEELRHAEWAARRCQCGEDEACMFLYERDEAREEIAGLRRTLSDACRTSPHPAMCAIWTGGGMCTCWRAPARGLLRGRRGG